MRQQSATGALVVVSLPAEIDVTNAGQVCDRLMSAAAPMIIANCTATVFCDAAGVRRLVTCQARAAARGAQLRLVIPPGGLLRRLLELLGADSILPVYPSVGEASVLPVPAARDPLSLTLAGRPDSVPWAHCDNHGLGRRGTPFATLRNSNATLRDGLG